MEIDYFTWRNLEVTETMRAKSKRGSLLSILDETKTAMGARLIGRLLKITGNKRDFFSCFINISFPGRIPRNIINNFCVIFFIGVSDNDISRGNIGKTKTDFKNNSEMLKKER